MEMNLPLDIEQQIKKLSDEWGRSPDAVVIWILRRFLSDEKLITEIKDLKEVEHKKEEPTSSSSASTQKTSVQASDIVIEISDASQNIKIVKFIGILNSSNIEKVSEVILPIINEGKCKIIADFSELHSIRSTIIDYLLRFHKESLKKGGAFVLAAIQEVVFSSLDVTGITRVLKIYKTVDEAIANLKK